MFKSKGTLWITLLGAGLTIIGGAVSVIGQTRQVDETVRDEVHKCMSNMNNSDDKED